MRSRRSGVARRRSAATSASNSVRDRDRKSTRLNSSHTVISYAVFCLKKEKHTPGLQSHSDLVRRVTLENDGLDFRTSTSVTGYLAPRLVVNKSARTLKHRSVAPVTYD